VSLQMIKHARGKLAVGDRNGGGGLVQCDAERLPFKDRSFDAVVSLRFMRHLDRTARRQVLTEMSRATRRWLVIGSIGN
jgi:ubiquinone/menaquinone biosynthesis C-methylase UbiE